jgi:hypothetical protein
LGACQRGKKCGFLTGHIALPEAFESEIPFQFATVSDCRASHNSFQDGRNDPVDNKIQNELAKLKMQRDNYYVVFPGSAIH